MADKGMVKDRKKQQKIKNFATTTRAAGMASPARGREAQSPLQQQTENASQEPQTAPNNPDLATVLREIQLFRTDISAKSDRLEIKMDLFQTRCNAMEDRIKELEERVSSLEDMLPKINTEQTGHGTAIKILENGMDGQENRSRRNNIRVIGLPEGSEAGAVTDYCEKLIREVLPAAKFTDFFSVVRAHRTLGPRPALGAPPRAMLIRFLHFKDRDAVLSAAREKGEIRYRNVRLHFYQDLSLNVQRERKRFDTAKQMMRDKKIKYSMMFPARLRVEKDGRVSFFSDPKAACAFAEKVVLMQNAHMEEENARNDENGN